MEHTKKLINPKNLKNNMEKKFLTPTEFAREFEVSSEAVRSWIREGKLKSIRTPGGHFKIPLTEVERIKKNG